MDKSNHFWDKWDSYSKESPIWIYQADRKISWVEQVAINEDLEAFLPSWKSHNQPLNAIAKVLYSHFIVLMTDATAEKPGGCSLDESIQFIKNVGQKNNIDFFNRWRFAYWKENQVVLADKEAFSEMVRSGDITSDTIVFDNMISTKDQFESVWKKHLKDSWHMRFV
jgi:hypothetical protein